MLLWLDFMRYWINPPQNWIDPETTGKSFVVFRHGVYRHWQIGMVGERSIRPSSPWGCACLFLFKGRNDLNAQAPNSYPVSSQQTEQMDWGDTGTAQGLPGKAVHTISTPIETFAFELGHKTSQRLNLIHLFWRRDRMPWCLTRWLTHLCCRSRELLVVCGKRVSFIGYLLPSMLMKKVSPNRLNCTLLNTVIIAKYTYRFNFDDKARPVNLWYLYLFLPLFLSLYLLFPLMLQSAPPQGQELHLRAASSSLAEPRTQHPAWFL